MLKASKARMADVRGTTAARSASWHSSCFRHSVPHGRIGAGDLRDGRSIVAGAQRSQKSWLPPTVMDGPALCAIDALPGRNAFPKAPRAAGYRGSDFVRGAEADNNWQYQLLTSRCR